MRWKALLLGLCGFTACWIVVSVIDQVGMGRTPWWGWWDGNYHITSRPFVLRFDAPQMDGALARAGVHAGDVLDLREQPTDTRWWLANQPIAGSPIAIIVHRGSARIRAVVVPTSMWSGNARLKTLTLMADALAAFWFLGCAIAIALRRSSLREGRLLAMVLLCLALSLFELNVPNAMASGAFYLFPSFVCLNIAWGLLVALSAGFGKRTPARAVFETFAYVMVALEPLAVLLFSYALTTSRFDPLPFGQNNFLGAGFTVFSLNAAAIVVPTVAMWAVMTTPKAERARAAWLLLPVPLAMVIAIPFNSFLLDYWHSWAAIQVSIIFSAFCDFVGALFVTYALLVRRVLDLEFILSRTLVVATISIIVVAAFTLLEWLLGSVIADVSRAAGVAANAALALVLGFSLRYIHQRVDNVVDSIFFRKRHEDERALRDYAKEAAYVTEPAVLLDQAIENLRRHTDARGAAVLLNGDATFSAVRSFGDRTPPPVNENDEAILALKTWHKPIDPHQYQTTLEGALALPMLARGKLLGVVLLDERRGGESYAPDETDALSEFSHGVASALETLSVTNADGGIGTALQRIESLLETLAARRATT